MKVNARHRAELGQPLQAAARATTRVENLRVRAEAGRARLALGRPADALPLLQESLAAQSDSDVRRDLARALAALDRREEALRELADAADGESRFLRADLLASLGRGEEALAVLGEATRTAPESAAVAYQRKGKLLLDLGRPKEATAAFDAALGLNPRDAALWCDAAVAWRRAGQEAKARKMLDRALALDPTSEPALRLRDPSASRGI